MEGFKKLVYAIIMEKWEKKSAKFNVWKWEEEKKIVKSNIKSNKIFENYRQTVPRITLLLIIYFRPWDITYCRSNAPL